VSVSQLAIRISGVILGLMLLATLLAAPSLTTIDDMLYKADGSLFDGVLMINWKSFEGPDIVNVPTNSVTVRVVDGHLFTKLVPTTTAQQAAYYSVRYVASGNVQFTELWSVPSSDTSLRVRDVRIEWPPTTTAIVSPETDISITDIDGLADALDARPEKGSSFSSSRAAIIGPTGQIEAAAGGTDYCIRVDGSAGPCGSDATAGFQDGEAPVGTIDGTNRTFALSLVPVPAPSLLLFRNGMLQKQGVDYTLTGNIIDFASSTTPQSGDAITAFYRTIAELTSAYGFADATTPSGLINGVNATFTLAATPNPASSLRLYRNGLLQSEGVDYSLSGAIVTFVSGAIPSEGDILQASFRTGGD
jgi:hypothetical protein